MRRYPNSLRAVSMKGIVPPSMAMPERTRRPVRTRGDRSSPLPQGRGVSARPIPLVEVEFRELLKRLETNPVMTLPASQQRPAAQNPGLARTVRRSVSQRAVHARRIGAGAKADSPTGERRRSRRRLKPRLSGRTVLGGERLAAGFFLSVTCTEDVPYLSKDADAMAAGTFGGNYRLEQQRAACKEWPRGTVSTAHRQPTKSAIPTLLLSGEFDPVTPPSGADEVVRGPLEGPSHRHSQQRSSDRQRRSVHRRDDRPVSRSRLRRQPSISAAPPTIPLRRSCFPEKTNDQRSIGSEARLSRAAQDTSLHDLHDRGARDRHRRDDGAVQRRARAADQAAALQGCRLAGRDVGAQPAAQPAAQRDQPGELPGSGASAADRSTAWRRSRRTA